MSQFLFFPDDEVLTFDELQLSTENKLALNQLIDEHQFFDKLDEYNLPINNKILLFGHTGCGKTATARALTKHLGKKILIVNLAELVSFRLGETAKNLNEVFQKSSREKAVLFLDEFDAIGKIRGLNGNDSGEINRLVNSIIQQFDLITKNTLLICATNSIEGLDSAIIRRFQLKLDFVLPTKIELDNYYDKLLEQYPAKFREIERIYDKSYAEAKDITQNCVKAQIIRSEKKLILKK